MATTYAAKAEVSRPGPPSRTDVGSRLQRPMPTDRLWGWLGPLAIALVAAYLRFNRLSKPRALVFDEVYYSKDSYDLLRYGVERGPKGTGPGFVVHPPLGKWLIAPGQAIFGHNTLGWRFAAALFGSMAVLILARTARRLTRSTLLGCLAGLLLALDGLAFVQSRVAMLDIFLMFWVLAAFACLVADRDAGRARLAARLAAGMSPDRLRVGLRWWRLGAGACLGAACATKWSAIYYVAAFGLLAFGWDVGARRTAGAVEPFRSALRADLVPSGLALLVLPALVYVVSWTGWFLGDAATAWDHDRYVRAGQGTLTHARAVFGGWLHYHWEAWRFHIHLSTKHPYQSSPWGWLLLARPVLYFATYPKLGELGCSATAGCARVTLDIGTPAIWWASIPATVTMAWRWISRRDWRAAAVLAGMGAGLLPWLATPERTMFFFYALPALPFMILGLTLCAGLALGSPDADPRRRLPGAVAVGAYALLVIVNFFYLYPVLAAKVIPYVDLQARMWFGSWWL
jgi:dolichyl-phosphate-mannose-protein mannosyltransferase